MPDILLEKINEVHFKVTCSSDSIYMELSDFFTFFSPDYKFDPRYRARKWDGKIRLFDRRKKVIYIGLLDYIISFADKYKYTLEYDPTLVDKLSIEDAKAFIASLELRTKGQPIEPHDYQVAPFMVAAKRHRLLFVSPTASGKSLVLYMIMRYLLDVKKQKKILLIVPTTSLVRQMQGDFKDYSSKNGWDAEANCQMIYDWDGKDVNSDKPVYISTWQSIYTYPKSYFEKFDVVFGDEAHTFKATSLRTIMEALVNAKYRVGCTGTLQDTKVHKLMIEGVFGIKRQWVHTYQLMERGIVSNLKLQLLILKYDEYTCNATSKYNYDDEYEWVIANTNRMNFIKKLALNLKGNTMILYYRVEDHGIPLYETILADAGDRKVYIVHGDVETDMREQIRAIVEKETNAIIVASYGTFSTGINIKNLHNIIFASPTKSKIRVLQSIGRGLRLGDIGTDQWNELFVYDIIDDLRYGDHVNYGVQHSEERLKYYMQEKFDYKFHFIDMKG